MPYPGTFNSILHLEQLRVWAWLLTQHMITWKRSLLILKRKAV